MSIDIIIGSRASQLAMWQAHYVQSALNKLQSHEPLNVSIKKISTKGDRILDKPLAQLGGKGLFIKEIEVALQQGAIDLAVHSLKDLPTHQPQGLRIIAIPKREDHRDALVLPATISITGANSSVIVQQPAKPNEITFTARRDRLNAMLDVLPNGARVGTTSLRRKCQLLFARPDLIVESIRGNVDTRLAKLDRGEYDALVLASAGLIRLGLAGRISLTLGYPWISAVGQGAIAIECREATMNDNKTIGSDMLNNDISRATAAAPPIGRKKTSDKTRILTKGLKQLNHPATEICVKAERAFLSAIDGDCHQPFGAICHQLADRTLNMTGLVGTEDGQICNIASQQGPAENYMKIGAALAQQLVI